MKIFPLLFLSLSLFAKPSGMQCKQGSVSITENSEKVLSLKTVDKTVLHWDAFSIDQGETVRFDQNAAVLNRVTSDVESNLMGSLLANGEIYLINPSGILIGKDARIDTHGFIASTFDVLDEHFLEGKELIFSGDSEQKLINLGNISCDVGDVFLIAKKVIQKGTISAEKGTAGLASGTEILLRPNGKEKIFIKPSLLADYEEGIEQSGMISAMKVELKAKGSPYAAAIQHTGSIKAYDLQEEEGTLHIVTKKGNVLNEGVLEASGTLVISKEGADENRTLFFNMGKIFSEKNVTIQTDTYAGSGSISAENILIHAPHGMIEMQSSQMSAKHAIDLATDENFFSSGKYYAFDFTLHGKNIFLIDALIDASGDFGGGKISIGDLQKTEKIQVSGSTKILADAKISGKGGNVFVLGAKNIFHGTVSAKGEDGGFIEVSAEDLSYAGNAVASARGGIPGTLLLDPKFTVVDAAADFPQYEFIDPNQGNGTNFGDSILALNTGNVLITKPNDNFVAADAGAVYLYNGLTGALISTLLGAQASDLVGSGNPAGSSTGNFIVASPSWANGAATTAGAVTFGNGTTGINGMVSTANSLHGSQTGDLVSQPTIASGSQTVLTNGNFVIPSPNWANGGATRAGAATWMNGTDGTLFGGASSAAPVSPANSLVGTTMDDRVAGSLGDGVVALSNGNYVVRSPNWTADAGAATFGNGATGTVGVVSTANSLYGNTAGDQIGITAFGLSNGNYIAGSGFWSDSGATPNAGALVLVDGTNGQTIADGVLGIDVTTGNSVHGTTAGDFIGLDFGFNNIPLVGNGNAVISAPSWSGGMGTAAWINGTTGLLADGSGPGVAISAANSLVGTLATDSVGTYVVALANGNYAVGSPDWDGVAVNGGAVTFGDGSTGLIGPVSTTNSLHGLAAGDGVGELSAFVPGTFPLANGNYVVISRFWDNGGMMNVGAATLVNGTTGFPITETSRGVPVSTTNSLYGGTALDQVGASSGVEALSNGNYVVLSSLANVSGAASSGAATFVNGTTGIPANETVPGVSLSMTNSLFGTSVTDLVGSLSIALTNGNYVVKSSQWDNPIGPAANAGAITFGDGNVGVTGPVSSANSIVGTTAGDFIGSGNIDLALSSGNYVLGSSVWDDGATMNAGAAFFGLGDRVSAGDVTAQNSVIGQGMTTSLDNPIEDFVNGTFVAPFPAEGSGRVRVGLQNPNQITYARAQADTITLTPDFITTTLESGTDVTIEANTSVTINSPIFVNAGGNGGNLRFDAGRSVFVNASITTDNGDLTFTANCPGFIEAFRDPGTIEITFAPGITLDSGSGNFLAFICGELPTNLVTGNTIAASQIGNFFPAWFYYERESEYERICRERNETRRCPKKSKEMLLLRKPFEM